MLDFYSIKDNQTKPSSPQKIDFVGFLDSESFDNLQKKGIIDYRFDYYSDFRFSTILIKQMRDIVKEKQLQNDIDVKKLFQLFDYADLKESGLIAYGD